MRIAVIGAGGTGGLYGGLLARAGHDVRFLARGRHLDAIRADGLQVRSKQLGDFVVRARASDDPADLGQVDLVLVAVKTYDLEAAARAAKATLGPETLVLTLQNGVEAPDQVAAVVGREHVLVGTTAVEATIIEPGVVAHLSPFHGFTVSELDGPPSPRVEKVVETFKDAGINAQVVPDGRRALWAKAALLVPMAALTAVCRGSIGPIRELPETRALLHAVYEEVVGVARAMGHDPEQDGAAGVAAFDRVPPTMKASMARDFERGNRTELEALLGAIVRLGAQHGVAVPTTRTIYAILKLRELSGHS